jgi:dCTP deaminase
MDNINGASIDVRLHDEVMVEKYVQQFNGIVDLSNKEAPAMESSIINKGGFVLKPQQFILASTVEVFNLPDDIACEFKLKSSAARAGLNHCLSGWADPSWSGSRLTLELKNELQYHSLLLKPGMKIGQMVFFRCHPVPMDHSYATVGRYNNTMNTTSSKGV